MVAICIVLALLAIALWHKSIHSKLSSAIVASLVFSSFFLSGAYYVADYITGSGIDESVLYHLVADMEGAAYGEFNGLIIFSLIYLVSIAAVSMNAYKSVRSEYKVSKNKYRISAALLAITMSFYVNPAVGDMSFIYRTGSAAVPDLYIKNDSVRFDGKPKNIVYLYLESVERTYLDENIFPGLMPNLKALEDKSLSFTDVHQVYGTNFTIAGMTASQCGIPLLVPVSNGNSMSGVDQFLPGATCIGDVLDEKGYSLNYMGGSKLSFSGKGNFYSTHGFDQVEGFDELVGALEDPRYKSSWGLHDDSLFMMAKQRYDKLSLKNGPFGLFLLTLDTHQNGHIAKPCENVVYQDGSNPILNAVHCTDKMAAGFIKHVMESETFKDTILVVSSDHLGMRNKAWERLQSGNRRNLWMVFGKGISSQKIAKPGSSLDIAPTVLNMMGANIDGMGFGRDLMRDLPSLLELDQPINTRLRESRRYLSSLWSYAQVDRGIRVDSKNNKLLLADRYVRFPALFILNEELNVTEIRFQFSNPATLSQQVAKLAYDQRFLWVDKCKKNAAFSSEPRFFQNQHCAAYGALGSEALDVVPLDESLEIKFSDLKRKFDKAKVSKEVYERKLSVLDRINRFGAFEVKKDTARDALRGRFMLRSAGFSAGPSYVSNLSLNKKTGLARGLTIVGIKADSNPVKLGHVDTCGNTVKDAVGLDKDFKSVIDQGSRFFGAFAIMAHDSARCGGYDLETLFMGTGLKRWAEIGFRQPYVGLIDGNGDVVEYIGDAQTALAIEATDFIRPVKSTQRKQLSLPRIAHAGGGYNGSTYTNSIDALTHNKDDYELFEIDFSWTSDEHLVCLHDWNHSFKRSFGLEPQGKVTKSYFEKLVRTKSNVQKCTLNTLADWLKKNNAVRIVTDVKERNVDALRIIARDYPSLQNRFVPQVYQPSEYVSARALGYDDVIFTLYRFSGSDDAVLESLNSMDLYGLTMPVGRAARGLGQRAKDARGVLSWVHTINSQERHNKFVKLGINQIYTDWLPEPIMSRF